MKATYTNRCTNWDNLAGHALPAILEYVSHAELINYRKTYSYIALPVGDPNASTGLTFTMWVCVTLRITCIIHLIGSWHCSSLRGND